MKKLLISFFNVLFLMVSINLYAVNEWEPDFFYNLDLGYSLEDNENLFVFWIDETGFLLFSDTYIFHCSNFHDERVANIDVIETSLVLDINNNITPIFLYRNRLLIYATESRWDTNLYLLNVNTFEKTEINIDLDEPQIYAEEVDDNIFIKTDNNLTRYYISNNRTELIDEDVEFYQINEDKTYLYYLKKSRSGSELYEYNIALKEKEVKYTSLDDFSLYEGGSWLIIGKETSDGIYQIKLMDFINPDETPVLCNDAAYHIVFKEDRQTAAYGYIEDLQKYYFIKNDGSQIKGLYSQAATGQPQLLFDDAVDFKIIPYSQSMITVTSANEITDLYISYFDNISTKQLISSNVIISSVRFSISGNKLLFIKTGDDNNSAEIVVYDTTAKQIVFNKVFETTNRENISIIQTYGDIFIINQGNLENPASIIVSIKDEIQNAIVEGLGLFVQPDLDLLVLYDPRHDQELAVYTLTENERLIELQSEVVQTEEPSDSKIGTFGFGVFGLIGLTTLNSDTARTGVGPDVAFFASFEPLDYLLIQLGFSFGSKKVNFPLSKNPDNLLSDAYIASDYVGIPVFVKGGYPLGPFKFFGAVGFEPCIYYSRIGNSNGQSFPTTDIDTGENYVSKSTFDILLGATVIYDLTGAMNKLFGVEYQSDVFIDILFRFSASDYISGETFFSDNARILGMNINIGLTVYKFDWI